MIYKVTLERLEEIEQEREKTMNDPKFQKWVKDVNVSKSYVDMSGVLKARDMINQYDYTKRSFSRLVR